MIRKINDLEQQIESLRSLYTQNPIGTSQKSSALATQALSAQQGQSRVQAENASEHFRTELPAYYQAQSIKSPRPSHGETSTAKDQISSPLVAQLPSSYNAHKARSLDDTTVDQKQISQLFQS